jgi:hypothetical protein
MGTGLDKSTPASPESTAWTRPFATPLRQDMPQFLAYFAGLGLSFIRLNPDPTAQRKQSRPSASYR